MKVRITYQDDDSPSVVVDAERVPVIGEKIGVRRLETGIRSLDSVHHYLDFVVDVRTYYINKNEGTRKPPEWEEDINVMTSSRR